MEKTRLRFSKRLPIEVISRIEEIIEILDKMNEEIDTLKFRLDELKQDVITYLVKEGDFEEDEDPSFFRLQILNYSSLKFVI